MVAKPELVLSERLDDGGLSPILDLVPEAILAIDQARRIRYFNRRSEDTFGYTADEVLGQRLEILLPEGAREAHERSIEQFAAATAKSRDISARPSMRGRHKNGHEFALNSTVCRLEIDGVPYFAAVLHDIDGLKHTELALRQSEESYRELIETSIQGMLIQQNRRVVLVNRAFSTMVGYESGELLNMDIDDFRHPDDKAKIVESQATLAINGEYEIDDARAVRKDGTTIWLQIRARAVEWHGRPADLITAIDITKRKTAEEEARRQRQYLATTEKLANVGSWGRRMDTDESYWSDEFYRILGREPGSIKSDYHGFLACVHPDDRARMENRREIFFSNGEWFAEELRIVRPNGDVRSVIAQWEMLQVDNGRPIEIAGSLQDITERRKAELELRDSEKRFRAIAENTPLALVITRRGDGAILFANRWLEFILGVPPEQIVGRDMATFYWQPDDRKTWTQQLDQDVQIDNMPLQMRRADGQRIATQHFLRSVTYDGEDAILGVFEDITERLQLEERLRQSQKMEAAGQLIGGVAHDFNNLLAVIIGNLAHLQEDSAASKNIQGLAASALAAAERGAGLTHRLLAFARKQPLASEPVDLNALVEGMEDLLRRSLGSRLDIRTALDASHGICKIDAGQMENAILNLAINSRDAMGPGGKLTIGTSNLELETILQFDEEIVLPGPYVVLSVTDTGGGMSPDVKKKALDPFFTTKGVGQGSGLGLSMVYGFIRQSGGYLRLESELGQGTTITIMLPRLAPDQPSDTDG